MLAKQELPASLPYPRPPGLPTHISSLARDSDAGRLSAWAKDCLESTRALESNAQVIRNSLRIRISSVNVALLNMGSHATALRKSYSSVQQGWDSVSNLIAFLEKLQTDRLLGQGSLAEHLNLREKYSEPDMSNLNSAIRDIEQDSFRLQMSVDDWQNEAESIWREIEANVNEVVVLTTKIEEDIARTKFRRLSEDVVPGLRESFDEVLMLRLQLENRYENDPNQALGFLKGLSAIQSRIYINSNAVRGHLLEEELINGINKDMEAYIMKLLKLTSREDLQSLLGQLKQEKALAPVVALLTESLSGESKRNSTMLVDNDNSRELKQLRLKLRDTQSRNHNLEDLIHRQKLRLNTAPSSHISSPTERESTLSQRVYEKSVEVTNLQDSLDQLRINKLQSAERVVSLEAKVKSQDEEIDELVATRSDALNSKSAMEEKLEDATAQLSKYEKEVAHLHEVQNELVAKFERELADCKGRLNFVENEKSDLQRNLDIYTTKFNSTQRRMSATEKEYVNFKINAEKVGEDLRIAKSENASLQEELEHARQSHATELASIEDASSNTIGLLRATLVSQQNAWGEEKASYQNTFENDRDLKILCESRTLKARELTQRLYTYHLRCHQLLENIGLTLVKQNGSDSIIERRNSEQDFTFHATDLPLIHWMEAKDSEEERDKYAQYLEQSTIDLDVFQDAVVQKFKSLTSTSKRYLKEAKVYRERAHKLQSDAKRKIAYRGYVLQIRCALTCTGLKKATWLFSFLRRTHSKDLDLGQPSMS